MEVIDPDDLPMENTSVLKKCSHQSGIFVVMFLKLNICAIVLDGINILLPVYGITNSKQYSVFHGILIKHN